MTSRFILIILSIVFACSLQASPIDTFEFQDEVTKVRFQELSKELRCPKCQNQNLADSNSPIAADLRLQVYKQLQEGRSDKEIIDYMVYRYGDFVLYKPKVNSQTYILWYGPVIMILLFFLGMFFVMKHRAKTINKEKVELSSEEQDKLKDLLNK